MNQKPQSGKNEPLNRESREGSGESRFSADLLSALSGLEANRERTVSFRTRRVVQSSMGVLKERKAGQSRARGMALAATCIVPLLIAPLIWEATESLIAGEHLADPGSQLSLWACVVCSTLLAAGLVAGWWRRNR